MVFLPCGSSHAKHAPLTDGRHQSLPLKKHSRTRRGFVEAENWLYNLVLRLEWHKSQINQDCRSTNGRQVEWNMNFFPHMPSLVSAIKTITSFFIACDLAVSQRKWQFQAPIDGVPEKWKQQVQSYRYWHILPTDTVRFWDKSNLSTMVNMFAQPSVPDSHCWDESGLCFLYLFTKAI